jgi:hypothetical protein
MVERRLGETEELLTIHDVIANLRVLEVDRVEGHIRFPFPREGMAREPLCERLGLVFIKDEETPPHKEPDQGYIYHRPGQNKNVYQVVFTSLTGFEKFISQCGIEGQLEPYFIMAHSPKVQEQRLYEAKAVEVNEGVIMPKSGEEGGYLFRRR